MVQSTAFLEKVANLFIEQGAKTLTMDDIAREFGMSKKTLYQMYENKEALLEEILEYKLNELISRIKDQHGNMEDAIDRMFCRDKMIEKATQTNNSVFIIQLMKYYPSIFNSHMRGFSERFSEVLEDNIDRGRRQGLYREDFDATLFSRIFFQLAMSYDNSPFIDIDKVERKEYMDATLMFFMHAITTEKGKEKLSEYKNLKSKE